MEEGYQDYRSSYSAMIEGQESSGGSAPRLKPYPMRELIQQMDLPLPRRVRMVNSYTPISGPGGSTALGWMEPQSGSVVILGK